MKHVSAIIKKASQSMTCINMLSFGKCSHGYTLLMSILICWCHCIGIQCIRGCLCEKASGLAWSLWCSLSHYKRRNLVKTIKMTIVHVTPKVMDLPPKIHKQARRLSCFLLSQANGVVSRYHACDTSMCYVQRSFEIMAQIICIALYPALP